MIRLILTRTFGGKYQRYVCKPGFDTSLIMSGEGYVAYYDFHDGQNPFLIFRELKNNLEKYTEAMEKI